MRIPAQPSPVTGIYRSPVSSCQCSWAQHTCELIHGLHSQSAGCQLPKGACAPGPPISTFSGLGVPFSQALRWEVDRAHSRRCCVRAGACPCVSWEPGSCGTGSGQWLLGELCDTREVQGMHAHVCICAPSCTWVRTCVCVCTACAHTNLPAHMRFPCLEETVSLHWLSCCRLPVFVSYRTPCLDVTGFGLQAVSAEPRPPLEAGLQEGGPAALMPPSTHRALSQHRHMWWSLSSPAGYFTPPSAHPLPPVLTP